eukprot:4700580-Amphidinium_carterae.1
MCLPSFERAVKQTKMLRTSRNLASPLAYILQTILMWQKYATYSAMKKVLKCELMRTDGVTHVITGSRPYIGCTRRFTDEKVKKIIELKQTVCTEDAQWSSSCVTRTCPLRLMTSSPILIAPCQEKALSLYNCTPFGYSSPHALPWNVTAMLPLTVNVCIGQLTSNSLVASMQRRFGSISSSDVWHFFAIVSLDHGGLDLRMRRIRGPSLSSTRRQLFESHGTECRRIKAAGCAESEATVLHCRELIHHHWRCSPM